jgi:small subunit ribosomal protein S18
MAKTRAAPRRKDRAETRAGKRPAKKKVCIFCSERMPWVDYKDVNLLRRFLSERAKIRARRVTGNCEQHQRDVAVAIKTARELGLLPYAQRQVADRAKGGGRRGRDRDGGTLDREMSAPPVMVEVPTGEVDGGEVDGDEVAGLDDTEVDIAGDELVAEDDE